MKVHGRCNKGMEGTLSLGRNMGPCDTPSLRMSIEDPSTTLLSDIFNGRHETSECNGTSNGMMSADRFSRLINSWYVLIPAAQSSLLEAL